MADTVFTSIVLPLKAVDNGDSTYSVSAVIESGDDFDLSELEVGG